VPAIEPDVKRGQLFDVTDLITVVTGASGIGYAYGARVTPLNFNRTGLLAPVR